MKIKNKDIESFASFLLSFKLDPSETRIRGKFIRLLGEQLDYITNSKSELINQFGKRDERGQLVGKVENNQNVFELEDPISFHTELGKLMNEDYILDNTNERKDAFSFIKNMVLDPPDKERQFAGQEAVNYMLWCDIVETIEYEE